MDQMGPESAKGFPGQELVRALPDPTGQRPAERATQEVDEGRWGKGYIFRAFKPADGEAFTKDYDRRKIANWVNFREPVVGWIPAEIPQVFGIVDNLNVHRATDVLLFSLAHPLGLHFRAQERRVSESDRTRLEHPLLARAHGAPLRDLGRARPGGQRRGRLLEQASASVHLGTPPTASATPPRGRLPAAEGGLKLLDALARKMA
jgi:hypothetical protein